MPTASVSAYKSAQYWSEYADYIVGYDFSDDEGSNLITFTVNGISYQAEEGMTWGDFINSEYNDGNFTSSNNRVKYNGYDIYEPSVTQKYTLIVGTIPENQSYIIYSGGGGGGAD